jgi:hypothetical protein
MQNAIRSSSFILSGNGVSPNKVNQKPVGRSQQITKSKKNSACDDDGFD